MQRTSGDEAKLIMALMACLLGYGEVGLWLKKEASRPNSWVSLDGNPYKKWIEDYSGEHYQGAVRIGIGDCAQILMVPSTDLNGLQSLWRNLSLLTTRPLQD
jgi:thiaminase